MTETKAASTSMAAVMYDVPCHLTRGPCDTKWQHLKACAPASQHLGRQLLCGYKVMRGCTHGGKHKHGDHPVHEVPFSMASHLDTMATGS